MSLKDSLTSALLVIAIIVVIVLFLGLGWFIRSLILPLSWFIIGDIIQTIIGLIIIVVIIAVIGYIALKLM